MIRNVEDSGSRSFLAVFAHPDDETFLAGGTLAKYAGAGWNVQVVCATRGEAGQRGEYQHLTSRQFGELRQRELEAACEALGLRPALFLDCADQHLARDCWQSATEEIIRAIRRLRPRVVLTFGPDGISGHSDHVALSQIVTTAFWGSGAPVAPSEITKQGAPFQPKRLYYVLRSASVPACCARVETKAAPPLTTEIEIAGFGERKLRAIQCYRSQHHLQAKDPATRRAILESPERFHRAVPRWEGTVLESSFGEPDANAGELSGSEAEHEFLHK
jgi:LmbE family N-acetylglucosaminyl deacetylase